jgi:hypothetical protein
MARFFTKLAAGSPKAALGIEGYDLKTAMVNAVDVTGDDVVSAVNLFESETETLITAACAPGADITVADDTGYTVGDALVILHRDGTGAGRSEIDFVASLGTGNVVALETGFTHQCTVGDVVFLCDVPLGTVTVGDHNVQLDANPLLSANGPGRALAMVMSGDSATSFNYVSGVWL